MTLTAIGSAPLTHGDFASAAAENMKNSWLYRIPDELLIMIVECLDGDLVTRLILGQVSKSLRRIVYSKIPFSTYQILLGRS